MPLVFVHGVNTRRGETDAEHSAFDNRAAFIAESFRTICPGTVRTPYWGDLGVQFPRGLRFLPSSGLQLLSVGQPEAVALHEAIASTLGPDGLTIPGLNQNPLLVVAQKRGLVAAVDLLSAAASTAPGPDMITSEDQKKGAAESAQFLGKAMQFAEANPDPAWLDGLNDDDEFLSKLIAATSTESAGGPQTLSVFGSLRSWLDNAKAGVQNAVTSLRNSVGSAVTGAARDVFKDVFPKYRPVVSTFVAQFIGDIATYEENRTAIRDRVLVDIDAAAAERTDSDPLILVGHSFGGIILYDVLKTFRPDLNCDLYITVGSQVAAMAEMGLLADTTPFPGTGANQLPRPAGAARWLNVMDPTDIIGFGASNTFSGVKDFFFETDAFPIVSHGAYFDTPRFYARLKARVDTAFQLGTD